MTVKELEIRVEKTEADIATLTDEMGRLLGVVEKQEQAMMMMAEAIQKLLESMNGLAQNAIIMSNHLKDQKKKPEGPGGMFH